MTWREWSLKASAEGRAWVKLLAPIAAAVAGWHLPQPKWAKKKVISKEQG